MNIPGWRQSGSGEKQRADDLGSGRGAGGCDGDRDRTTGGGGTGGGFTGGGGDDPYWWTLAGTSWDGTSALGGSIRTGFISRIRSGGAWIKSTLWNSAGWAVVLTFADCTYVSLCRHGGSLTDLAIVYKNQMLIGIYRADPWPQELCE